MPLLQSIVAIGLPWALTLRQVQHGPGEFNWLPQLVLIGCWVLHQWGGLRNSEQSDLLGLLGLAAAEITLAEAPVAKVAIGVVARLRCGPARAGAGTSHIPSSNPSASFRCVRASSRRAICSRGAPDPPGGSSSSAVMSERRSMLITHARPTKPRRSRTPAIRSISAADTAPPGSARAKHAAPLRRTLSPRQATCAAFTQRVPTSSPIGA